MPAAAYNKHHAIHNKAVSKAGGAHGTSAVTRGANAHPASTIACMTDSNDSSAPVKGTRHAALVPSSARTLPGAAHKLLQREVRRLNPAVP